MSKEKSKEEKVFKYYLDELARKCFNKPFKKLTYAEQIKLSEYEYDLRHTKWKPVIIDGKDTGALVSNTGIVVNKKGVKYEDHITEEGYVKVHIAKKKYFVHRLVAIAFIPNPEKKPEVDHINAIKTFNWVGNLRWATRRENFEYARAMGLQDHIQIDYTEDEIRNVCKMLEDPKNTPKMIMDATGISKGALYSIRIGKSWTHISKDYNIKFQKYNGETDEHQFNHYTKEQIHEVCRLLQDPDNNPAKVAKITGVGTDTIQRIRMGKDWKCISQNYNIAKVDFSKGEGKVNSKFTDNDIKNVCKALEDPYKTLADISKETGVSFDTVHKIYQGKQWTHISKDYNIAKRENPKSKLIIDEYKKGKSNTEIFDILIKEFGESGDRRHILLQIGDVVRRYKNKVESSTTSESA